MQLQLGKMSTQNLAAWFGVSQGRFRNASSKFYEKLKDFCDYEKVYGGIIIKEIYYDTFDKKMQERNNDISIKEVARCQKYQNGLGTTCGMARRFSRDKFFTSEGTAIRRLTETLLPLFGVTSESFSRGEIGRRDYVWGIKLDNYNHYRLLTEEENKRFNKIIASCYMDSPEKIRQEMLLRDALRDKEITSDEYFEQLDRLGLDTFKDCIFKFRDETGFMVVRCTRYEIFKSYLDLHPELLEVENDPGY